MAEQPIKQPQKIMKKAIIVSETCPVCNSVKEYIERRGLKDKVTLINASTPEGREFALSNGIKSVPECVVIDESGKQVKVCNEEEFKKYIEEGE